jgi:pimeloyl-ACP methyl ester carboxylesterase
MNWDFRIDGKLVRFETKDGMLLHGFLISKSEKIVIHIAGMGDSFYDSFRLPSLVGEVTSAGYSLLLVNNRGHDTITGIPTTKGKWKKVGTALEKFEDCLKDIGAAVDFVSRYGFKKIILSGHSTGCQKIAYYQSKIQDKRVNGLILLAPTDDYNYVTKKEFGMKFSKVFKIAKRMVHNGKGGELLPAETKVLMSARRFLSDADTKNVESRIFNYDSKMQIFSKIRCPIFVIFGSKEKYRVKPVNEHFKILERRTKSLKFKYALIKGADHGFTGKEKELAKEIGRWLKRQ